MAEAIIKFSDLIEDDGGFNIVRKELEALGEDLKKKASEIKGSLSFVQPSDNKQIQEMQKQIEELKKTQMDLIETNKSLSAVEKEYLKNKVKSNNAQKLSTKSLDQLYVKLEQHKVAMKMLNKAEKEGQLTTTQSAKAKGRLKLEMKAITTEISKQEKEVIASNKLSKEEQALLKAKIVLQKKETKTMNEMYERMKALRILIKETDITTQEGIESVKKMNDEINSLSEVIQENSDKYIQQKMNIGNYKNSIIEALEGTSIFSTGIGVLDKGMSKLIVSLKKNTDANDENSLSLKKNYKRLKGNVKAIRKMKMSWKSFSKVLKASGIMLIIGALASMFAIFKQGRSGVVKTQKAMKVLSVTISVLINTLGDFGGGLIDWFKSIGADLSIFTKKVEKAFMGMSTLWKVGKADSEARDRVKQLSKEIEIAEKKSKDLAEQGKKSMWSVFTGFGDRVKKATQSIKMGFEAIEQQFIVSDRIKSTDIQIAKLTNTLNKFQSKAEDSTLSMQSQLQATKLASIEAERIQKLEMKMMTDKLRLANLEANSQALSTGIRVSGINVINAGLKGQIAFTEQLLAKNKQLGVKKNPLDDALLQGSVEALKELKAKENEYNQWKRSQAKLQREIRRDIFEQELDFLIDVTDKNKALAEQLANDMTRNFKYKVSEMKEFGKIFIKNAQDELDLFNKLSDSRELKNDFKIKYYDDGSFDVLRNNQRLSLEDAKKLNSQLKETGLSEITLNRFKEFVMETKMAQKDFNDINKSLAETKLRIESLKTEDNATKEELEQVKAINKEYELLLKKFDEKGVKKSEQKNILKQLEALEKKKTNIKAKAEEDRLKKRLEMIEKEKEAIKGDRQKEISVLDQKIKNEKEGSDRYLKLLEERKKKVQYLNLEGSEKEIELNKEKNEILLKLEEKIFDKKKESNDKKIKEDTKYKEAVEKIVGKILDKWTEVIKEQLKASQDKVDRQKKLIDEQKARAEKGMDNTLAFEKKMLAKKEGERLRQEKKLKRAEQVKALWTSYTSHSKNSKKPNEAIMKTIKDFAILTSIEASFGDGGLVNDKIPLDRGITRGRSHNGQYGGIPVMVEGGEGFLSRKNMDNLGNKNFYDLRAMLENGPLKKDAFKTSRKNFEAVVNEFNDARIIERLDKVADAIMNKPENEYDLVDMYNGMMKLTKTTKVGRKTTKNHLIVKKNRL